MMPGFAPSTPALNEPSMSTSCGVGGLSPLKISYTPVASPKYQTLPSFLGQNQSSVDSVCAPFTNTTSRKTMHVTPAISFVSFLTSTVFTSVALRYSQCLPTPMGKYGFGLDGCVGSSNRAGLISGS